MSSRNRLVVIGAGDHCRAVIDLARSTGFDPRVVVDTRFVGQTEEILGVVLRGNAVLESLEFGDAVAIAIGDNAARRELFDRATTAGWSLPNIVHSTAVVSRYAQLGRGNIVNAGAVVNAQVVIGDNCIINTGAIVDHETRIESHCHIGPGVKVASRVKIGEESFLSIGSIVIDQITLDSGVTMGAGAAVVQNVGDTSTAVGVPARSIR